ncbi:hypothetical protein GMORB2_2523 [Geosmithia morbida]|uniref:BZIP domain-containing protein n=1 Tax=Geosmithia morbida TaxID=1094350 RepID=A0A9P5CZY8_9HYPO|nr:uncharacterized protein GMORB2_2523 [Geosmithia morbida]KAF4121037.1 hypothetical protein GMORB2_2523 [Geosmithia morbida]
MHGLVLFLTVPALSIGAITVDDSCSPATGAGSGRTQLHRRLPPAVLTFSGYFKPEPTSLILFDDNARLTKIWAFVMDNSSVSSFQHQHQLRQDALAQVPPETMDSTQYLYPYFHGPPISGSLDDCVMASAFMFAPELMGYPYYASFNPPPPHQYTPPTPAYSTGSHGHGHGCVTPGAMPPAPAPDGPVRPPPLVHTYSDSSISSASRLARQQTVPVHIHHPPSSSGDDALLVQAARPAVPESAPMSMLAPIPAPKPEQAPAAPSRPAPARSGGGNTKGNVNKKAVSGMMAETATDTETTRSRPSSPSSSRRRDAPKKSQRMESSESSSRQDRNGISTSRMPAASEYVTPAGRKRSTQCNNDHGHDPKSSNRQAAHKFRTRKRHSVERLKEAEATARSRHQELREEATRLRHEKVHLQNMILEHGECACPYIDDYIQAAARTCVARRAGGISGGDTCSINFTSNSSPTVSAASTA